MTPIQLRPYQQDCVAAIRGHFQQGAKRVLFCAPTGAGKTVMFSYIVQQTLAKSLDARTLILTDRIELHGQAGSTLEKFGLRPESITAANARVNHRARCYVGMVETYYNRLKQVLDLPDPKLSYLLKFNQVIFDEAHKSAFFKIFKLWDSIGYAPYVIGVTATPISAKKNDPLSNYYQAIVNRVQIGDLIADGYLSPCVTYSAKLDRAKLKTDNTGEYSDASQMDTFATRTVYDGLLHRYREVCDRYNTGLPMKTIIFNVNVAHSLEVTQMFNEAGIPARHVDGMTPQAERESIIFGYKSGAFPVICNVGILNAGFDDHGTSCIVMNRATTSVSLWLQSAGRGSRISPQKERFVLLDMGDNWTELGLWESERDWENLWNLSKRKNSNVGVSPVKVCDNCSSLVALSARLCSECGYLFPAKAREMATSTDFVEVTADMVTPPKFSPAEVTQLVSVDKASNWKNLDVATLENIRQYRGRKPGWVVHVLRDNSETEYQFQKKLTELAQLRGYKPSWAYRQEFKAQHNYESV